MMIDIGMLKKLGKGAGRRGRAPCGGDVSYDPASEAIQAEFDKLTRASKAMTPVDWPRVVAARRILSRKSKDFTIACRLGVGLLHTERIAGLGLGAEVLGDMIGTFWNDMYPPIGRERRRLNALAWWKEHAKKTFLNTVDARDGFADDIESAAAALRRLDGILAEKIADAPGSRDLIVALERMPVAAASEPDGPPERTTGSEPSITEGVAPESRKIDSVRARFRHDESVFRRWWFGDALGLRDDGGESPGAVARPRRRGLARVVGIGFYG